MPRKKVTKSKVKKLNRQPLSSAEIMEKDFRTISNKLPELFRKDVAALKKQEAKLQFSLQKIQKQQAAAKNKHVVLETKAKVKPAATTKKQLTAAKKTFEAIAQASMKLAAQLDQIKNRKNLLSQKQSKFTTLCKYIPTLDKEWDGKNAKANKPATKLSAKSATKQRSNPSPATHESTSTSELMNNDLVIETVE